MHSNNNPDLAFRLLEKLHSRLKLPWESPPSHLFICLLFPTTEVKSLNTTSLSEEEFTEGVQSCINKNIVHIALESTVSPSAQQ